MLGNFCLRLACGLICSLLLLSPHQINPRFYRTHFLTVLGLTVVAALFLREAADAVTWICLAGGVTCAFAGALAWSLEKPLGGKTLIVLDALCLIVALIKISALAVSDNARAWNIANELTSAALLGTATTAMLMGHSYLIAPGMSLAPLLRLLAGVSVSLAARGILGGVGLWTSGIVLSKLSDETVMLPVRWGIGIVLPLVLAVMAWQTARIRSTQSATGILYVVVIFCFVGELVSQLLFQWTTGRIL
jgi:hypothetical protein